MYSVVCVAASGMLAGDWQGKCDLPVVGVAVGIANGGAVVGVRLSSFRSECGGERRILFCCERLFVGVGLRRSAGGVTTCIGSVILVSLRCW